MNNTAVDVALSEAAEKTKLFDTKIGTEHNINLLKGKNGGRGGTESSVQMGAQSSIYP